MRNRVRFTSYCTVSRFSGFGSSSCSMHTHIHIYIHRSITAINSDCLCVRHINTSTPRETRARAACLNRFPVAFGGCFRVLLHMKDRRKIGQVSYIKLTARLSTPSLPSLFLLSWSLIFARLLAFLIYSFLFFSHKFNCITCKIPK